jgi:Fungal Zn(2)-Cys(6) binuclear cluster domain
MKLIEVTCTLNVRPPRSEGLEFVGAGYCTAERDGFWVPIKLDAQKGIVSPLMSRSFFRHAKIEFYRQAEAYSMATSRGSAARVISAPRRPSPTFLELTRYLIHSRTQMDTNHQADASDDQLGESEINEILRRKRKVRGQRACYPCRQRKVKCNHETPCQRCIERGHTDLCRYQPASKRQDVEPPSLSGPSVADGGRPLAVE